MPAVDARPGPRRRDAVRNRERLLQAARTVFAEQGPTAPLEDVARRADVSRTTLYRHFSSREQLAALVYEDGMRAIEERALHLLDDPWGAVRLVDFVLRLQGATRVPAALLTEALAESAESSAEFASLTRRIGRALGPLLHRATESGALREGVSQLDVLLAIRMAEASTDGPVDHGSATHHDRARLLVLRGLFRDEALSGARLD